MPRAPGSQHPVARVLEFVRTLNEPQGVKAREQFCQFGLAAMRKAARQVGARAPEIQRAEDGCIVCPQQQPRTGEIVTDLEPLAGSFDP